MYTRSAGCTPVPALPLQRFMVLGLVAIVLLTSFTGHAGVQLLDGNLLTKLYSIHQHGVSGEAEFIATHGTWQGFVHDHCHRIADRDGHLGPDHVQSAATLAGAVACTSPTATPNPPPAGFAVAASILGWSDAGAPPPLSPPPQP